jgi:23S rRNA (uracil1939-C5)-methyltransferase
VLHAELGPDFALDVVGTNLKPGEPQRWQLPENVELFAPSGCFTQVNWAVNTKLVETVVGEALRRGARRFCDAFSGAGNFSLPLAARGLQGLGIDESQAAIAAAREAARASGLSTVEFIAEDVTSALRRLLKEGSRFDLLIIDPPRAGARAIIESIAELRPAQLAVCSCDPVTLSRDLRVLVEGGFFLDQITAFDMFPHTHHLEALAWLHATRRNDP